MKPRRLLRTVFLASVVAAFPAIGLSESAGQSGGSTSVPSRSGRRARPALDSMQGQFLTMVSGIVVMEDGSELPPGTVIQRVCGGRPRKEAEVDSLGRFGFQLGRRAGILDDAGESTSSGTGDMWSSSSRNAGSGSGLSAARPLTLLGCELRAYHPGYRSSSVVLGAGQPQDQIDVGTIVLSPLEKVKGTVVSLVSLQAPKKARNSFEKAERALENGRSQEAERKLKEAIDAFPRFAAAWHELGELYRRADRLEEAHTAFSKALEGDQDFVSPYIGLAKLAGLKQDWPLVAELTDHALGLNPLDFPEGFYFNALAKFQMNNYDAAELSARKAVRLDSEHRFPQAHLLVAEILGSRKDTAGQAAELREYLRYAPPGVNADRVRARLLSLENAQDSVAIRKSPQP